MPVELSVFIDRTLEPTNVGMLSPRAKISALLILILDLVDSRSVSIDVRGST